MGIHLLLPDETVITQVLEHGLLRITEKLGRVALDLRQSRPTMRVIRD